MNHRSDFPLLNKHINDLPLVYFDNAATTQKPQVVIDVMTDFYQNSNANVHRGINPLAEEATKLYEDARATIANFIDAQAQEIIFTRGTTESINLVARAWGEEFLKAGDIVVLSQAEHHANYVPWLQLKDKLGIKLSVIPLLASGELDLEKAKKLITEPNVKLLALTHASNVLGLINPISDLFADAQERGIITLLDAAQTIGHLPLNVQELHCDFLVVSSHKMYGPTGVGILFGRAELLEKMPAFLGGGNMISAVYADHFTPNQIPAKFEAGTPPIAEAIGMARACDYLNQIGWSEIAKLENDLTAYMQAEIAKRAYIKLLGTGQDRLPVFSFFIDGIHAHDLADLLGQDGIITRAGHHCAQPLHDSLGVFASLRLSLSFYNTSDEIDRVMTALDKIYQSFN
jgi:cysteine desulfurase/selenocysteine lyase